MGEAASADELALRRKCLRYRCGHCGMKEMDLILGAFADAWLERLTAAELAELEALLTVPDDLLYRWLSGREPAPQPHDTTLFRRIAEHAARGSA